MVRKHLGPAAVRQQRQGSNLSHLQRSRSGTETSGRTNGITIGVHSNNFRSIRGWSLIGAVLDETSFWRDETSAIPDVEVYTALLPALATAGGLLIGISSTYRRAGLIFEKWRDYYGKAGGTLVIRGPTKIFNPTIDAGVIRRARAADPVAAASEWDAEFRADLAAFLDDTLIDGAIDRNRPLELPPRDGVAYHGFCDASGGRHDAFTDCVAHREDELLIVDVIRGHAALFNPASVAEEFATLLKSYRIASVAGDHYSGDWVVQAFERCGVRYDPAKESKSNLYLEALPAFAQGAVRLPNHSQLVRELRMLERHTHRSGRDSVDHGANGSDDFANAVCGALHRLGKPQTMPFVWTLGGPNSVTMKCRAAYMKWAVAGSQGEPPPKEYDAPPDRDHGGISQYQGGDFGRWARGE